jgi:hypothetical protein
MPIVNDDSIPNDMILLRVLLPGWTCTVNSRYRPQSLAFRDGVTGDVSCFIQAEGVEAEVRRMYPNHEIATVTAGVVRDSGYAIERRPGECEGFNGDPNMHVIIGSPTPVGKKEKERCSRRIAEHDTTTILPRQTALH